MRNVLNANFQCRQFGLSWAQWLDFHSKLGKKVTQYEQWIIIEICTLYTLKVVTDISPSPYTCSTPFPVIFFLLIGWLGKLCWWAWIMMWPLPRLSRWIRGWGVSVTLISQRRCLRRRSWCPGISRIMWFQFIADNIAMQTMAEGNGTVFKIAM